VALEVSRALRAPLDVLLVRKIGAPQQRELAIAAVVEGKPEPYIVIDEETLASTGATTEYIERQAKSELREIARRRQVYLHDRPSIPVAGRDIVLVDDGIATGTTVRAALKALKNQNPARLILAVPVAPKDTVEQLREHVDDLICLAMPYPFGAIGYFYDDFHQLGDEEVIHALQESNQWRSNAPSVSSQPVTEQDVLLEFGNISLPGIMQIPRNPKGVVVFAHGSGSSRLSTRNRQVADRLSRAGLATLLFDLLTPEEDQTYSNRFAINLLKDRLLAVTEWLTQKFDPEVIPFGYFGASTGAAAALWAAAASQAKIPIRALVSRGGRPDLVSSANLHRVTAPTLLIIGGLDEDVIEMNRRAAHELTHCTKEISIVPHATHLFEEPGCLDKVADLAVSWFNKYLVAV